MSPTLRQRETKCSSFLSMILSPRFRPELVDGFSDARFSHAVL